MFAGHRRRPRAGTIAFALTAVVAAAGVVASVDLDGAPPAATTRPIAASTTTTVTTTTVAPETTTSTTTTTTTTTTTIPPTSVEATLEVGAPWGTVPGILMFRGNPTRTWFGTGPLPAEAPEVAWRYPDRAMCGDSTVGGETTTWCGTGWTGQPVVWERPDGVTEVIVGAYDGAVHFVDATTGAPTREPFRTSDLVKGSVTLDPDGFPLLYVGSRDNRLRILALDREPVEELWFVDANQHPGIWNNDWDANPLVVEGRLIAGGENGFLFAWDLDRTLDADGLVAVAPVQVAKVATWDDDLIRATGDRNASVESSPAVWGSVVYVANSGGRVLGLDLGAIDGEEVPVTFDFWTGDDTDATLVLDEEGYLYVAVELERGTQRAEELGQVMKLDPLSRGPEVVWSVAVPARGPGEGGVWATPALGDGVLYVATHPGELLAIDTATGEVTWRDEVGYHAWSSPVIVNDTLLLAVDCDFGGGLRAYDLDDPRAPVERWDVPLRSGCIESTPAVWDGAIYVGSRDGFLRRWG
ncbi:MAG: PQQ-binding-like beta-propeller repeat protein [Acidimicrobiia bacterium]|nr:PQQ-binding-like beta-propeller repeat protein [Acidimicrobiia bacterium]